MTAGFTSLTTMASTTFLPSDRSLMDIMMSVRRGQQVKRGRCGSSNMANMFQRKCLLQYLTGWDFMRYLKMKFTSLQKYICTYQYKQIFDSVCYCLCAEIVLTTKVDFYIFAEVEDAIIFPRSPDSVPHSHAGANLVHGDLKLIVKILRTISYQSLKRKKILVVDFMRLFHGYHNISWL